MAQGESAVRPKAISAQYKSAGWRITHENIECQIHWSNSSEANRFFISLAKISKLSSRTLLLSLFIFHLHAFKTYWLDSNSFSVKFHKMNAEVFHVSFPSGLVVNKSPTAAMKMFRMPRVESEGISVFHLKCWCWFWKHKILWNCSKRGK